MIHNRANDESHRLVDRFRRKLTDSISSGKRQVFAEKMKAELDENFYKGDRDQWLNLSRDEALVEIRYHLEKLEAAVEHGESKEKITEYAVDVGNCAMIFLDVMGYIEPMHPTISDPMPRNLSDYDLS